MPEPSIVEISGNKTRSVFDRYPDPTVDHLRKGMTQIATHRGKKPARLAVETPGSTRGVDTMWTPDEAAPEDDEVGGAGNIL